MGMREGRTASIIRAMMKAVRTSETSVYSNETTRCYVPEGSNLKKLVGLVTTFLADLGGLMVACLPLDRTFAALNPAEDDGFLKGDKNP
jgi:hypothetical protein